MSSGKVLVKPVARNLSQRKINLARFQAMVHQLSNNRCLFRMKIDKKLLLVNLVIECAEQTSIANLTSTHSKVGDTILSPGQSSADLMIAGVQELHGSTFDATVMQTDPSKGRNQLRSDRVSAYRNSTLDQRYLQPINTNYIGILTGPFCNWWNTNIDEFEVDDNFGDKLQWAEQRAVSLSLPLQNIDTVRESNPRPLLHASEPLMARLTRILRCIDSTQAQYGVMNRNRPRGRCSQSSHLERNHCKYDLMLLASGTQGVRVGDVNDGDTDRSSICDVL
jgi:hypothetical protein